MLLKRTIMVVAGVVALLLGGHRLFPDLGGVMPVVESLLPWLGAAVPVLLLAACCTRCWRPMAASLVPAAVWGVMFGPALLRSPPGGPSDLSVATLNVGASNGRPGATVRAVAGGRDLVGLQEMTRPALRKVRAALGADYPSSYTVGTVGLWSRHPIASARPIDVGLGWDRGLRAVVRAPGGDVTVYVMHLASARPGHTVRRDQTLDAARRLVEGDRSEHLLLLGDLNTATTDRRRSGLVPPLEDAQLEAGTGFGFTWPAGFPITRPDHILYRGLAATEASVEPAPGSDHRAATAGLRYDPVSGG
ncbi:endonuclease/exonuclease/phosphatase family protein [Spongiactinospora sp. TRM90649]|uniref:endonuclease/exonuclease/phosphatase family protein n=1 Tax=Spongiactinospora sp. TRM90649 TaxID=3031114 RepID=UPI0023F8D86C|nr:endonuclease/exonuclease/phosphatase family protein [Spongiactinospora sp. TRM90649]MDF5756842.1 endonuclease/exonuclease/phosphatase family protein [Spongiactinospora sp. TRM90649]